MSKKKLDVEEISNELAGASLFFSPPQEAQKSTTPSKDPIHQIKQLSSAPDNLPSEDVPDEKQLTSQYNEHDSNNASMLASKQDSRKNDLIKTIRKSVRQVGKEVLFVRLSSDEKHAIGSIVYAFNEMYRGEGFKTSENEIGRIAVNYLLEDYQENRNNSILAQVLAALKA